MDPTAFHPDVVPAIRLVTRFICVKKTSCWENRMWTSSLSAAVDVINEFFLINVMIMINLMETEKRLGG